VTGSKCQFGDDTKEDDQVHVVITVMYENNEMLSKLWRTDIGVLHLGLLASLTLYIISHV
jgi:hypothetical protein